MRTAGLTLTFFAAALVGAVAEDPLRGAHLPRRVRMTTTDEQGEYLAAFLAAHPPRPLKGWEQREADRVFDVEPPEVDDDPTGERADEAAAAWENGWIRQGEWAS